MARGLALQSNQGFLLETMLVIMGILGVILAMYLSIVQHEVRLVTRAVARAQALYLAEAGLDAANDLIWQNWKNYHDASLFPMRERVAVGADDAEVSLGEFQVAVDPLSGGRLRLTSVGRCLPSPRGGADEPQYGIERTLSLVLVSRWKPSFQRVGPLPGSLQLKVGHFDKNGMPDLIEFSGSLDSDGEQGMGGALSTGSQQTRGAGGSLLASFVDVDGDGNLDLVLFGIPFLAEAPPRIFGIGITSVDLFHTSTPIPVVANRRLFLPEGHLQASGPGTDVFLNKTVYDGTQIVSWGEQ